MRSRVLAHESEARNAKAGIWARPFYRCAREGSRRRVGNVQIVEGRSSAPSNAATHLPELRADYRSDFTGRFSPRRKRMAKNGTDPPCVERKAGRVRDGFNP